MAHFRDIERSFDAPLCPFCGAKMWLWSGIKYYTTNGVTAFAVPNEYYACDNHPSIKHQTDQQGDNERIELIKREKWQTTG